jgi:tetratricopeptide (TPR) repeat protein
MHGYCDGQSAKIIALQNDLRSAEDDTSKVKLLNSLAIELRNTKADTAIILNEQALQLAEKLKWDKGICSSLTGLAACYETKVNYREAGTHYKRALALYEKNNDKKGIIHCTYSLGAIALRQSDYQIALEYFQRSLKYAEETGNQPATASRLANIASVYGQQSKYPEALEYFLRALKISEAIGDKKAIASTLGNIGIVYLGMEDIPQALDYALKALWMEQELGNKRGVSIKQGSIGNIFLHQANTAKKKENYKLADSLYNVALEYYFSALKIDDEIGNKNGISTKLGNVGNAYMELGGIAKINNDNIRSKELFDKALEYYLKAYEMEKAMGSKNGMAIVMNNIASLYIDLEKFDEAEKYLLEALKLSKEINGLYLVRGNEYNLYSVYYSTKRYDLALQHYKNCMAAQDSIFNEENTKKALKVQMQYEYNKKEIATKADFERQQLIAKAELENRKILLDKNKQDLFLLEQENALKELKLGQSLADLNKKQAEADKRSKEIELLNKDKQLKELEAKQRKDDIRKQKLITYGTSSGGLLLFMLLAFAIRGSRQKKKANAIISEQKRLVEIQKREVESGKELVEEKQKEILDSINYAKRLQDAILPSLKFVTEQFPESYVFYQPKDIVAGDFYWMEKSGNLVFIAAADCTGHGVPGAMVSVVCSNALNRAVKEFGITEPGKILDKTRELVVKTFEKSGSDVKDGMDISLCAINYDTNELHWSGANNPLWYLDNHSGTITEIKPDKQPIGKSENVLPFTTHTRSLQNISTLYLFTDGYADQFGGPSGKKFKYKPFENFLLSIRDLDIQEQKAQLQKKLNEWKGSLEQVDDILVIVIRL